MKISTPKYIIRLSSCTWVKRGKSGFVFMREELPGLYFGRFFGFTTMITKRN